MSDINLEWLEENFGNEKLTFFNIGCADITDDTLRFQMALRRAQIYSFDCADFWKDNNINRSLLFNLHYLHSAVSFFDGDGRFLNGTCNSSDTKDRIQVWNYTGKLTDACTNSSNECDTPVISINTFCDQNCVKPDFFHIDTEGEEYNILKFLRPDLFPLGIWIENWNFYRDGYCNSVPFATLDAMMHSRSYIKVYAGPGDTLYLLDHVTTTPYREYKHSPKIPWDQSVSLSSHERTIQQRIWLRRYALCKDDNWPELKSPSEFFFLPDTIKQQCNLEFDLVPSQTIL